VEIFPAGYFFKKQDFLQVDLLLTPGLRSPTRFVGRSPPLFGGRSPPLSLCVPEVKRSEVGSELEGSPSPHPKGGAYFTEVSSE
jgi:hypothetical protein